jgi:G3E family GTPase
VTTPDDQLDAAWTAIISSLAATRRLADPPSDDDIGVTVLTGFLGSGKTTVLKTLLEGDHGLRIGVVVNDLAAINIDSVAISDIAADRVDLTNGCACCSLSDDLADALREITSTRPDAVVLEASGASDPVAFAHTIGATRGCRLDGIVAIADIQTVSQILNDRSLRHLAQRQFQAAHLILLSKTDTAGPDDIATVTELLARVAPGRMILPIAHGDIDPRVLTSAAGRGANLSPDLEERHLTLATALVQPAGPWPPRALADWLDGTRPELLRAKGWFTSPDGRTHGLQLVGRSWTIEESASHQDPVIALIAKTESAANEAATELTRLVQATHSVGTRESGE